MAFSFTPHPQDEQMLLDIRRYLIGYRITNGWTQQELSQRINGTTHAALSLEKGGFDWGFTRLQDWPIPFGLKLQATPMFCSRVDDSSQVWSEVIEEQPIIKIYEAALRESLDDARAWQRMYLTTYLKVAREKQGISRPELGRRLGITPGAISSYEIHADNVRLVRMLNHARALGGRIMLTVS